MKTIAILLIALMSLYMVSGAVAAKDMKAADTTKAGMNIIKGKITSIDMTKNVMVIKDIKTKAYKTIIITPEQLQNLKIGEEVKVSLKTGSNVAESVKK